MKVRCGFYLGVILLAQVGFAEVPPSNLLAEAKESLPRVIEDVFNGDKTSYGFTAGDELKDMSLGMPFRIHLISPSKIESYKKNDNVLTLANNSSPIWHCILLCKNQPRTLLTIGKENGKWQIVEMQSAFETEAINMLLQEHGQEGVVLFKFPALRQYLFHLPKTSKTNLNLISNLGEKKGEIKTQDRFILKSLDAKVAADQLKQRLKEKVKNVRKPELGGVQ